ncbi:hypothetical protein [Nitrosopumilus piranensis]|uniref:Uncharacterized protein n=1 Tax=Nitrosopumilus piranensis TaxID=1582439 RepID=A0A0C5C191_9ARCH|nr:hypothetical protein [Nitrosopumilus piranensis]AJM93105.1 hypothetical protein NPIRD3C_1895 [Nitrosopumilus piranensis]
MKYHKIAVGLIGIIAVFGFVVPFVTVAHCDSIQVFDDSCFRFGGSPTDFIRLAGAEIYYDYLIYHMNQHLVENPNVDDEVFSISGDIPKEFPNSIVLKYDDTLIHLQPEPRTVMIDLVHNSTVSVFNESNLSYNILSRSFGNTQLFGTVEPDGFWIGNFTNVGVYTYQLDPISEYDTRATSFRVLVIDEPVENMPKSIRHNIACQLFEIDHTKYPYSTGRSCGGSHSESISIDFHKSLRGASSEFKQEFLDKISENAGFLKPEITFDYDGNQRYWSIPFPLLITEVIITR